MKTKACALALGAAALAWTTAAAADGCHSGPFNGVYIGATVGYVGIDADHHPEGMASLSSDDSGVIAGGHVGYNMQCGRIVVGIEGDLSYVDLSTSAVHPADQTSFQTSLDWLGTLRGRLGVTVHDTVLLYATAGVAWGDRTHSVSDPGTISGIQFSQSDSDTATGWVVGAGVEFLRHERWVFRAEVLRIDLGDETHTYNAVSTCGAPCESRVRWDDEIWTARIGVSLKLGGHEHRHYEPLK